MKANIPQYVIVDTGFWFAYYDEQDNHHKEATQIITLIEKTFVLIPWPSLYEVLNTGFIKNPNWILGFDRFLKKPSTKLVDDKLYKESALKETIRLSSDKKRHISLVDMVIRQILMDTNYKIDSLITFNERDFVDICQRRKIQIL